MPRGAVASAAAAAVLLVVLLNLTPIHSTDFWIQLKVGDLIRETGHIPRTVLFTYTEAADRPFVAHEWLASVAVSAMYDAVGYAGMVVWKCAAALTLAVLLGLLAWQTSGRNVVVAIAVAALCSVEMHGRLRMRPELWAYLLLAIDLNCLAAFLRTRRIGWLAPLLPIAVVWANSHGSFLLELGIAPLFLLGSLGSLARAPARERREHLRTVCAPLAAVSLLLPLVSLLNPYGVGLFDHALALGGNAYFRQRILEWMPTFHPVFRVRPFFLLYMVFATLLVTSAAARWRRLDATAWLLLGAFLALSTFAIRHTAWLGLAGAWVLGRAWGDLGATPDAQRSAGAAVTVVLLAGSALVGYTGDMRGHRVGFEQASPLSPGAVAFLEESDVRGNVFNSYNLGDGLVYHFWPRMRVSIDSRGDAYGEDYHWYHVSLVGRSYRDLGDPTDLIAHLERYDVQAIVQRPSNMQNWGAKGHLEQLDARGWFLAYEDDQTVILLPPWARR